MNRRRNIATQWFMQKGRVLVISLILLSVCTGSVFAAEPVWPNSNTRFYPGIYGTFVGIETIESAAIHLNDWWGDVDRDLYREYYNGHRVSHIGLKVMVRPEAFFSSYWYNSSVAPYDYAATCSNSTLMQDPNAVVNGHPVYDWSLFDGILNIPEVVSGEYKIHFTYDDQDVDVPAWWKTQGMMNTGSKNPRKYDWAYARMKMDMLKAWATRYAGDPRIVGIELEEVAGIQNDGTVCGYVAPDQRWKVSAVAGSQMYPAMSIVEADPGMMVFLIAPLAYGEDLFTGLGSAPGLDDVPGIQGLMLQDLRFFEGACGSGDPGTVDCNYSYSWLQQQALVRDDLPTGVRSDANGWNLENFNRRLGDKNPWSVSQWPNNGGQWDGENVGGAYDGNPPFSAFADFAFWTWYTSGAPRAEGDKADSHLGQVGKDPAGLFASTHYMPKIPWCDTPGCAKPAQWNAHNMTIERARKAFEIFGPSGTKAMFAYPKGYLEQFDDVAN